ncbi:DUF1107 family protein [Celerinatantimonas yamalensis]|uniref:DUF1107 family protein n=1 Tax=Celerinatantimonas yamalensis TaxID=559956 RepID=A0ABW9G3T3_9GAMM
MKIFKKYSPKHIARYVKAFFKGRIYIQGRGAYAFEQGKLVMLSDYRTDKHRQTVAEINRCIERFSQDEAA